MEDKCPYSGCGTRDGLSIYWNESGEDVTVAAEEWNKRRKARHDQAREDFKNSATNRQCVMPADVVDALSPLSREDLLGLLWTITTKYDRSGDYDEAITWAFQDLCQEMGWTKCPIPCLK